MMRKLLLTKWPQPPESKCSECAWIFTVPEDEIFLLPTLGEMVDQFKRIRQESFEAHRCEDFPKKQA